MKRIPKATTGSSHYPHFTNALSYMLALVKTHSVWQPGFCKRAKDREGGDVGGEAPFLCMNVYEHKYIDVYEHE